MEASILEVSPSERKLNVMRQLADLCSNRPLIHELVVRDVHRWHQFTPRERREALIRARRRVGAVCPWLQSAA